MPKRIVFCADGTWNGPEQQTGVTPIDSNDDQGELNGAKVTNVVKLFANLAGRVTPETMAMRDEQEKVVVDPAGGTVQIAKYIHADGAQSAQLVMGVTQLASGSVWNTMPAHSHFRRTEVYLYFDVPDDGVVVHLMGEPNETRHLIVRNEEVVLSPPWSIHSGCGTSAYTFCWAMGGENRDYTDMQQVAMGELR